MKKIDLKTGMVVEHVTGHFYLVFKDLGYLDDCIVGNVGYTNLSCYSNDLKYDARNHPEYDIVKVYKPKVGVALFNFNINDTFLYEKIFDRRESED